MLLSPSMNCSRLCISRSNSLAHATLGVFPLSNPLTSPLENEQAGPLMESFLSSAKARTMLPLILLPKLINLAIVVILIIAFVYVVYRIKGAMTSDTSKEESGYTYRYRKADPIIW